MDIKRLVTPELVLAIARRPFEGPDAPCDWGSVNPLTQIMLQAVVEEHLRTAIPVQIDFGWTPPSPVVATAEELARLQAVEARLKWLATKADRTQPVGRWWGNEVDACLNVTVLHRPAEGGESNV